MGELAVQTLWRFMQQRAGVQPFARLCPAPLNSLCPPPLPQFTPGVFGVVRADTKEGVEAARAKLAAGLKVRGSRSSLQQPLRQPIGLVGCACMHDSAAS